MSQIGKYAFANAKIRAMRSFLIDEGAFSRLFESADIHEVMEALKKTPYKDLVEHRGGKEIDLVSLEKELLKNDVHIYRKVRDALSSKKEKDFVSLLIQRYELDEVKVALRLWAKKIPADIDDYLLGEKVSFDIDFKKIVRAGTVEEAILLLDHTPYKVPLLKVRDKFKERNSSFYLEAALDFDYYQRLALSLYDFSSADRAVASKILGVEIDIENISWLIRLRKYYNLGIGEMLELFIPGGMRIKKDAVRSFYVTDGLTKVVDSIALGPYAKLKDLIESNIYLIENFLYEVLLHEVKRALAGFPFTIGAIMGYLILKRKETESIISLLYAKSFGWKKESITPLMGM